MDPSPGPTYAAAIAFALFSGALIAFLLGGDRIAAGGALAGLVALSLAFLAHVSDPRRP